MTAPLKAWPMAFEHCQQRREMSGDNVLYEGFSNDPTATPADAKWAILMHIISGGVDIGCVWANNSDAMDKVWNNRSGGTYTYQSS
jgi:hypothetical protein